MNLTAKDFIKLLEKYGTMKAISRATVWSYGQLRDAHYTAVAEGLMEPLRQGNVNAREKHEVHDLASFLKHYKVHKTFKQTSRATNTPYHLVRRFGLLAEKQGKIKETKMGQPSREEIKPAQPELEFHGEESGTGINRWGAPKEGVRRMIFTCAQSNTKPFMPFWDNLLKFANHVNASVHVSRFTYNKKALGGKGDKDQATGIESMHDPDGYYWDSEFDKYLLDERTEVAPGLVFCGEMNTIPTAVRPLSGLDSYTGTKSSIFPHTKIALESVATTGDREAKLMYTTGTVTQHNYIKKKAGLKAEFHHAYSALLVEVDADGDWFVRHLNSDSEGSFYDLGTHVTSEGITENNRPQAILWGDIHAAEIAPEVNNLAWGHGGMLDILMPHEQHAGDILAFMGRSHHNVKDPHAMLQAHLSGLEDVAKEIRLTGTWMKNALRPDVRFVAVASNHHEHLGRWLKEQNGMKDPINMKFWLDMNAKVVEKIYLGERVNYFRDALDLLGYTDDLKEVVFLHEDEEYAICTDSNGDGGIECGMHGDRGPNGARGSALGLSKVGNRSNIGHSHSTRIVDGCYQAGTSSVLRPDFCKGPGSWSWSHILTYPNAKRTIITMRNGKWRA